MSKKNFLLSTLLCLFLFYPLSFAMGQSGQPQVAWSVVFGGQYMDFGESIETTSDGGFIIVGEKQLTSSTSSRDIYLVKLSANGTVEWEKTFGDSVNDKGYSVRQTIDGGYIITGTWRDPALSDNSVVLIKTDSSGNQEWMSIFGDSNTYEYGYSVWQTSDGGYLIGGTKSLSIGYGQKIYLIKTDSLGVEQWNKQYSKATYCTARSVRQTSDGGYIVGYDTSSSMGLLKIDANGNQQWSHGYSPSMCGYDNNLVITPDNGYALCGYSRPDGSPNEYHLLKTDSSGNEDWNNTYGGESYDSAYSVALTSDGGYVLTGSCQSFGASNWAVYVVKTDANGMERWNYFYDQQNAERGEGIVVTADGGVVVLSNTKSLGSGDWDINVFKLTPPAEAPLEIISANGGETWNTGSIQTITWTSASYITEVSIEYSIDNGVTWNTIEAQAANSGRYNWTVQETPSNQCLLRISDYNGTDTDTSDAVFTIAIPIPLAITSPNGGEVWGQGGIETITYNADPSVSHVFFELSTDNGVTWDWLDGRAINPGTYMVFIPSVSSDQCLVRVVDPMNQDIDSSDAVFSIGNYLSVTLTSPNGGEVWDQGSWQTITWEAVSVYEVSIEISVDNGSTWEFLGPFPNTGSANVQLPLVSSNQCLIRVLDPYTMTSDTSDAVFSIRNNLSVTIVSPNGGETFIEGHYEEVTWTSNSLSGSEMVLIEFSVDAGNTWNLVEPYALPVGVGIIDWTIPSLDSATCMVRIREVSGIASDTSDNFFTLQTWKAIFPEQPFPEAVLIEGTTQAITWFWHGLINFVTLEYSTDAGQTWQLIDDWIPNTGSYQWTVPDLPNTPEVECMIRIQDAESPILPGDLGFFTIIGPEDHISTSERDALIVLYNATNGDYWNNNSNWKLPGDPSQFNNPGTEAMWTGVKLSNDFKHVVEINLESNNLTGTIPDLSALTHLTKLSLYSNGLTGTIPSSLANLSNLTNLFLSRNHLEGQVPQEIGNMTGLTRLTLNGNKLSGNLPVSLMNLTNLYSYGIDLHYNAVWTNDTSLRDFINSKQNSVKDFESTQTVAPINLAAGTITTNTVQITWDPVVLQAFGGGYQVFCSTTPGDNYQLVDTLTDLSSYEYTITNLASATTYYVVIKAFTNSHSNNLNIVTSDYSTELTVTTY